MSLARAFVVSIAAYHSTARSHVKALHMAWSAVALWYATRYIVKVTS